MCAVAEHSVAQLFQPHTHTLNLNIFLCWLLRHFDAPQITHTKYSQSRPVNTQKSRAHMLSLVLMAWNALATTLWYIPPSSNHHHTVFPSTSNNLHFIDCERRYFTCWHGVSAIRHYNRCQFWFYLWEVKKETSHFY